MSETLQKTAISHDFDFLFGTWRVENRRLTEFFQGSDEWQEFEATLRDVPVLEGLGNVEELINGDGTPIGMAVRSFDALTQRWSDSWLSFRDGILQPSIFGTFSDGVGMFEADDEFEGKPIRVRSYWIVDGTDLCRWEQECSNDDGQTWEKNWLMRLTRKG